MIKRLISNEQRKQLKNLKKYRGKKLSNLSDIEKDELLELIAKKLGFL